MPFVYRFRVELGNFGDGSPGVNILHTTTGVADDIGDMGNFMQQIHNGYDTIKDFLVEGMTVNVNAEVTKHDVETGKLVGVFVVLAPATVTGTSTTSAASRATQVVCRHNTDAITFEGRRLIGRTYVGPIGTGAIDATGHITPAAQAAFTTMWDGMQDVAGTCRLVVLHRFRPPSGANEPEDPGTNGSFGHVITSTALPLPGSLRSRRD